MKDKDIGSDLSPSLDEVGGALQSPETPQEIVAIKKPEKDLPLRSVTIQDVRKGDGPWTHIDEAFVTKKNDFRRPVLRLEFWKSSDRRHGVRIKNIEDYSTRVLNPTEDSTSDKLQYSFNESDQSLNTSLSLLPLDNKGKINPSELSSNHDSTQLIEVTSQENGEKSHFLFTSNHDLNPSRDRYIHQPDIHTFKHLLEPVEIE